MALAFFRHSTTLHRHPPTNVLRRATTCDDVLRHVTTCHDMVRHADKLRQTPTNTDTRRQSYVRYDIHQTYLRHTSDSHQTSATTSYTTINSNSGIIVRVATRILQAFVPAVLRIGASVLLAPFRCALSCRTERLLRTRATPGTCASRTSRRWSDREAVQDDAAIEREARGESLPI
jgi:hypothetical protein